MLVSKDRKLKVNGFGLTLKEFTLLKSEVSACFAEAFMKKLYFLLTVICITSTSTTSDYLPNA